MRTDQLEKVRRERWRQDGNPLLTLDDAEQWLENTPLCLFLPRRAHLPVPAPSFVEAVQGKPDTTPAPAAIAQAHELLARLIASGAVVPLNLFGTPGERPDFLATPEALSFVYALQTERNPKKAPSTTGTGKVSRLASEVWKLLEHEGALTAAELRERLGREVTEAATVRALGELWHGMRVVPVPENAEDGAHWELLVRAAPKGAERRQHAVADHCAFRAGLFLPAIGSGGYGGGSRDVSLAPGFAFACARCSARAGRDPATGYHRDGCADALFSGRHAAGVCGGDRAGRAGKPGVGRAGRKRARCRGIRCADAPGAGASHCGSCAQGASSTTHQRWRRRRRPQRLSGATGGTRRTPGRKARLRAGCGTAGCGRRVQGGHGRLRVALEQAVPADGAIGQGLIASVRIVNHRERHTTVRALAMRRASIKRNDHPSALLESEVGVVSGASAGNKARVRSGASVRSASSMEPVGDLGSNAPRAANDEGGGFARPGGQSDRPERGAPRDRVSGAGRPLRAGGDRPFQKGADRPFREGGARPFREGVARPPRRPFAAGSRPGGAPARGGNAGQHGPAREGENTGGPARRSPQTGGGRRFGKQAPGGFDREKPRSGAARPGSSSKPSYGTRSGPSSRPGFGGTRPGSSARSGGDARPSRDARTGGGFSRSKPDESGIQGRRPWKDRPNPPDRAGKTGGPEMPSRASGDRRPVRPAGDRPPRAGFAPRTGRSAGPRRPGGPGGEARREGSFRPRTGDTRPPAGKRQGGPGASSGGGFRKPGSAGRSGGAFSKGPGSRGPASKGPGSRGPASKSPGSRGPASKGPAKRGSGGFQPPRRPSGPKRRPEDGGSAE